MYVGVLGIEPSQHGPKPCVLPVYDTPLHCRITKIQETITKQKKNKFKICILVSCNLVILAF